MTYRLKTQLTKPTGEAQQSGAEMFKRRRNRNNEEENR